MEVTVKDGQTLADIAVQEHGTWEAALDMAMENGVSLTTHWRPAGCCGCRRG